MSHATGRILPPAGSLSPILIVPAVGLWIDLKFIRMEEQSLRQSFGSGTSEYQGHVGRWL